jgi:hypothetical protein
MATKYNLTRDINGYNGFGLDFTDTGYNVTLTASTDTTLTVPNINPLGGASYSGSAQPQLIAIFSYTAAKDVWVSKNAAASVPAGATLAASSSRLLPTARKVQGGDVLHFYTTASSASVDVQFYWIGQ